VRGVLDASLLVAAVRTRNPRSASRLVIEAAAAGLYQPVITDDIEAEYREVLSRDRIRRGAPPTFQRLTTSILDALVGTAERVEPDRSLRVVKDDPKDDKYVAAALASRAEYVVTFDRRHLLVLGRHQGVQFVTPGDFLGILRSVAE
jgi:putative PIN family toxin of toxin-antitoxin system